MKHLLSRMVGLLLVGWMLLPACKTLSGDRIVYLIEIERGDTLAAIADKYDTTWQSIVANNDIASPDRLEVGQVIRVVPGPAGFKSTHDSRSSDKRSGVLAIRRPFSSVKAMKSDSKSASESKGFLYKSKSSEQNYPKNAIQSQKKKSEGGLLFNHNLRALGWPVAIGYISSRYGWRRGKFHHGIDIAARRGTNIRSARSGQVSFVGWQRGYGRTIIVKHGNIKTLYAHCYRIKVSKGQWVRKDQIIGLVGATGNARGTHLHFEVRKHSKTLDPMKYLPRKGKLLSAIFDQLNLTYSNFKQSSDYSML